jgi:hypothetical protein
VDWLLPEAKWAISPSLLLHSLRTIFIQAFPPSCTLDSISYSPELRWQFRCVHRPVIADKSSFIIDAAQTVSCKIYSPSRIDPLPGERTGVDGGGGVLSGSEEALGV